MERIREVRVQRYRWDADLESGYSECQLIYDSQGRLLGMDYRPMRARRTDV